MKRYRDGGNGEKEIERQGQLALFVTDLSLSTYSMYVQCFCAGLMLIFLLFAFAFKQFRGVQPTNRLKQFLRFSWNVPQLFHKLQEFSNFHTSNPFENVSDIFFT